MKSLLRQLAVLGIFWAIILFGIPFFPKIINLFIPFQFLRDLSEGFVIVCAVSLCNSAADALDTSKPPFTIPLIISIFMLAVWYILVSVSYFATSDIYWGIIHALLFLECAVQGGVGVATCISHHC